MPRSPSNTVEFTRATPPGTRQRTVGSLNSGCMRMADHAALTVGGASTGPSATTTVDSVLPPRIMPP